MDKNKREVLDRAPVIAARATADQQAAGSIEDERAAFEAALKDELLADQGKFCMSRSHSDGRPYTFLATQWAYRAWQARAALDSRAQPVAPRPTDDELWDQTIRDRDTYHEWADKLAEAISKHFGTYIGEHSNTNCPWAEALEAIDSAQPVAAGELPPLPGFMRRHIERAIKECENPKGMSVHNGMARVNVGYLRRLLVLADAAACADSRPAGGATDLSRAIADLACAPVSTANWTEQYGQGWADCRAAAATLAASVAPNQAGFEAWANSHGGLPLDRANDQQCEEGFFLFPTYKHHHTEIAWRAWANKPVASVAQPERGAWTVSHNGKTVTESSLSRCMAAARQLRTPEEAATAAGNLAIALAADKQESTVDWLGLALDLEQQAKRVESQTVERAMTAAAHGLRLMAEGSAATVPDVLDPADDPKFWDVSNQLNADGMDDVIECLALKHIATSFHKAWENADYKKTEQFKRVKAFARELIFSKPYQGD